MRKKGAFYYLTCGHVWRFHLPHSWVLTVLMADLAIPVEFELGCWPSWRSTFPLIHPHSLVLLEHWNQTALCSVLSFDILVDDMMRWIQEDAFAYFLVFGCWMIAKLRNLIENMARIAWSECSLQNMGRLLNTCISTLLFNLYITLCWCSQECF